MKTKIKSIIIASLIIIMILSGLYVCPWRLILGLSCPTCGLTRAFISVLSFKFKDAFHYHLMWPFILLAIIILVLYEFNIIKIRKKTVYIMLYSLATACLIYYFYRLCTGSEIVYFNFKESLLYTILK